MAKGIYIGGSGPNIIDITASNISEYFTVTNESYYFEGNGSTFTSNNGGVGGSTAQTTLTAKRAMASISFSYSYSSEANYDKFTLIFAGTAIENAVSGSTTVKTYSGALSAGQTIVFKYVKDGSVDRNDDKCTFYNIKTQDGTIIDHVARKIEQPYIGVSNVARTVFKGYVGVDNVARICYSGKIAWKKHNVVYSESSGFSSQSGAEYTANSSTVQTSQLYGNNIEWGYSTGIVKFHDVYDSYNFSANTGFSGSGTPSTYTCDSLSEIQALESKYFIPSKTMVFKISVIDYSYSGKILSLDIFDKDALRQYNADIYTIVYADEGQLPEDGVLVAGSISDGYCTLEIDGHHYYYVKKV